MPKRAPQTDYWIIAAAAALVAIGIVLVYSSSSVIAEKRYGDGFYFLKKQLIFMALGFVAAFLASRLDYRTTRKWVYPFLMLAFILLVVVLLPGMSTGAGGSRRWLRMPGFAFQPSEMAKLAVVLYLAHSIAKKPDRMRSFRVGFLPHIAVGGVFIALIHLQPDFGTAAVLGALLLLILHAAGARLAHIGGLVLALLPVIYFLVMGTAYRRRRVLSFLDPWQDPTDTGFQIIQSYLAFGSGGVTGVGLGDGKQKLFYLPEAHTDFALAVLGEELGLIGVTVVIMLFAILIWRGIRTALDASEPYGMFLALGLTLLIGLQALINMAVVTGLMPTKGLALPFLSYGGSSLVMSMLAVGLLVGIGKSAGSRRHRR